MSSSPVAPLGAPVPNSNIVLSTRITLVFDDDGGVEVQLDGQRVFPLDYEFKFRNSATAKSFAVFSYWEIVEKGKQPVRRAAIVDAIKCEIARGLDRDQVIARWKELTGEPLPIDVWPR